MLSLVFLLGFFNILFALSSTSAGIASGPGGLQNYLFFVFFILAGTAFQFFASKNIKHQKTVLFIGIFLAATQIFGTEPHLDDDVYRYIWDGFVQNQGLNPSLYPPKSELTGFPSEVLKKISYQQIPTVYPPIAQWFFALVFILFNTKILYWKLSFFVLTALFLFRLTHLAKLHQTPNWLLVILLLNPLLHKEFVNSMHIDVLALLFTIEAMIQARGFTSSQPSSATMLSYFAVACLLALSFLTKPIAILPFVFYAFVPLQRKLLLLPACFGVTVSILYGFHKNTENILYYLECLKYFNKNWIFNPIVAQGLAGIFEVIVGKHPDSFYLTRLIAKISTFGALFGAIFLFIKNTALKPGDFSNAAKIQTWVNVTLFIFLLSQVVVNPWYLFIVYPLLVCIDSHFIDQNPKLFQTIALLPTLIALSHYVFWISNKTIPFVDNMFFGVLLLFLVYIFMRLVNPFKSPKPIPAK